MQHAVRCRTANAVARAEFEASSVVEHHLSHQAARLIAIRWWCPMHRAIMRGLWDHFVA